LQDWQLSNGRVECFVSGGYRNLFLLTHRLEKVIEPFEMSVQFGRLDPMDLLDQGWIGFSLGIRGQFDDYRDDAVHGQGYPVGITTDGRLFIGGLESSTQRISEDLKDLRLELNAEPSGDKYLVVLRILDNKTVLSRIENISVDPDLLVGGVAFVSSHGKIPKMSDSRLIIDDKNWHKPENTARGGNVRIWFKDWIFSGKKVGYHPNNSFGPVLFSQYTLSGKNMNMTAQMPPVGKNDPQTVSLEIQKDNDWNKVSEDSIDASARTATFRIDDWDSSIDTPYRLVYGPLAVSGEKKIFTFEGTVRKEPWDKEEISVAGFTGNNDLGFPNNDILIQLKKHDPDVLFFSGDQIYERVGGYGIERSPLDNATLDYLRKWYLYGWAYGDLMRNRPTVALPDDHDVYQGNIWGAKGRATAPGLTGDRAFDSGGYYMDPEWVNMVQRTQTSHLPEPFDPNPVQRGIEVYFTDWKYAGISFAILEDRKFKSSPTELLPQADVVDGWAHNKNYNVKKNSDMPEAVLLGERQLAFLKQWSEDWSNKTWMKVTLSQTIFSNVATLPRGQDNAWHIAPQLHIFKPGEYADDDMIVQDMDSNGWPKSKRDKALRFLQKAYAFHYAGDQHLGSFIQYGIEDWRDSGYAFCVPSISNVWPRRWFPPHPGKNQISGAPKYTGDYEDGFGNKLTVHAVSNPIYTGLQPESLYDRATGFGIVRFNRSTRDILVECWPRQVEAQKRNGGQYPGWPIVVNQLKQYDKAAKYILPQIKVSGMADPVIQVIDESNDQIVYTVRIKGETWQPRVFKNGSYKIRVGEPDQDRVQILKGIKTTDSDQQHIMNVRF
jgi:hypothetical protein